MTESERVELETAIGHRFGQPDWLEQALTHSSRRQELVAAAGAGAGPAPAESGGTAGADNQKLEFLGDAVLGLVASEYLLKVFPAWSEGQLSKSRARLVSAASLSEAAQRLQLGRYLRLGRGEEKSGGREKHALLADAFEAVVAAIYLDAGLPEASRFVRRSLLEDAVREQAEALGRPDHKSALQEYLQGRGLRPAEYRVVQETGPDHRKRFVVEVRVEGRALASSEGSTKKEAEQAAARLALGKLREPAGSS